MKKPNFLIIGAARSGSTSLAHFLSLHPKLYLPKIDHEPKFFSREPEYYKGIDYYLQQYFKDADCYVAVGEKSTEYMENLIVATRIYNFYPKMKLICILRDPVERAISNYWWSFHNGVEKRSIDKALLQELENYLKSPKKNNRLLSSRPHAYIDRSLYFEHLKPFYELFPGNVKCVLFEEFVDNRKKIIDSLWLFLGLTPLEGTYKPIKAQRAVIRTENLDPQIYRELKSFFIKKNNGLAKLTGIDALKFWK